MTLAFAPPLPPDGPTARLRDGREAADTAPLRVGIVNLMPRAETYEPYLLGPLARARFVVEPVWLRLESHASASSDAEHIRRFYTTFEEATRRAPLDGLIVTGAPVEELPFEEVRYWGELSALLAHARAAVASTLGICWGGLALAYLLGVPKCLFPRKLFGVFPNRSLAPGHALTSEFDDVFFCPHSRHSGIRDADLEAARDAEIVTLLSHGEATGYTLFESRDHAFVAHLGHPEYEPARIVHEWERDATLGRPDVGPPENVDLARPAHVWRSHRAALFEGWLALLAARRARVLRVA